MVRSSGHHRKRSLSRSLSPSDHKRVKSSHRDREKERSRRRSRSRDRVRRSRSRDRKVKEKRPSESRVRSKPLKLKRRSRSRSRSREHTAKKEEKKEIKADDEPFDPTNLDKQKNSEEIAGDEDWIVTDMVQENSHEEDNDDEIVQNNDIDESNCNSNEIYSEVQNNHEKINRNYNKFFEPSHHRRDSRSDSENDGSLSTNHSHKVPEMGNSLLHVTNGIKSEFVSPEHKYDIQLLKNKIDFELNQEREFHQLRMKNEKEKHNAEMKLIKLQMEYWQLKYSKSSLECLPVTESKSETCQFDQEIGKKITDDTDDGHNNSYTGQDTFNFDHNNLDNVNKQYPQKDSVTNDVNDTPQFSEQVAGPSTVVGSSS